MKQMSKAITLPSDLLINPNKQPLRVILPSYQGITHVPSDITAGGNTPELMVFIELNKCFQTQNCVAEGLLGDVIWGLEQCGYANKYVASGLAKLKELGYIQYTDGRSTLIHDLFFDPNKPIWIKYTKKFTDLFAQVDGAKAPEGGVEK